LVELAPIEQDELIAPAVAGALGVQEFRSGMDLEERLLDHLEAKEALLVVDNCEHLVAETAHLVAAMLSRCRRLRVLATSREPLRVEGEVTVPVLPLAAPSGGDTGPVGGYDAVRLFCERVTAVVPGFELDDGNRAAVGQICARLDGIPLALELAAARTRSFTPDEIAARLTDRFQFLTSGARDSLPHHRTLEAALTWSYELLEAKERLLFDRLSVFAGGFSLAAAEAVCASDDLPGTEVVDVVAALVAKSLVIAEQTSPAESRYRLLESLRAFGRERLAIGEDLDQIARRHAFHFAEVAERSMSQSYGEEQTAMLRHMASEQDNIRAALSWTLEHDEVGLVTRIAAATWWFWYLSGSYTEAFNWLQRTVDLEGDIPAEVRVNALNGLGSLAQCLDEMEIAASRLAEAIEIARRDLGPSRWLGSALHNMAEIQTAVGDHEQARQLYEESLAVDYEIHHPGVALTLCMRGYNAICRGKLAEAEELLQESLAATGEVAAMEVVTARAFLALAKVLQGHSVAATEDISRAIAIGRRLDLTPVLVDVLLVEALVARSRGKCSEALAHLGESLRLARQAGSAMMGRLEHLAWWLRTAATIHAELELWRPAATLAGAAAAVQELSPTAAAPWSRRDLDRQMEEVRTRLGGEEFEESWKAGLAMTSDDAVRLALGPTVLSTTGV
jgi:non-specific serine/threonine protein kinase